MPYATIRDADMFYTDDGEGPIPLVFIHGWTCDSHDWSWQLAQFADSNRVIAFDLRGHGRSSAPPDGYEVAQLASDVAELLDVLGVSRAILIGHSLGGVVASKLAATSSQRVHGVVVMEPPYGFDDEGARRNLELLAALKAGPANEVVAGFLGILDSPDTPAALRKWHQRRALGTPPHVIVSVAEGMHGSMEAIANLLPTIEMLADRRVPVLAIHIGPERADWERELLHGELSRSVSLDGAGHWVHQERPADVNALIGNWIAEVQTPR